MKLQDDAWKRLVEVARRAPRLGDEAAPYGFSTRVAAAAMASRPQVPSSVWLRAAGIACLLAVAAVAVNYGAVKTGFQVQASSDSDDSVTELVDAAS